MALYVFNDGIPASGNNPSEDQPDMLINNVSTNGILNVDHIGFNQNNGGLHRQVNMFNQSSPARLGDLVAYSALAGGVPSIWVKNSSQDAPLFTGQSTAATIGQTSMYGGIRIKWGFVNSTSSGTVTFSPAFSTCFTVYTQIYGSSSASLQPLIIKVKQSTVGPTGFDWASVGITTNYSGFYWLAIGN